MTASAALAVEDGSVIPQWEFQDRFRRSLREVNLTFAQLAEILDVSEGTVSRWGNGKTSPNKATRMILATLTGVDLHWLETGEAPTVESEPVQRARRDSNPKPSVLELVHSQAASAVRTSLTPNRTVAVVPALRLVEGL